MMHWSPMHQLLSWCILLGHLCCPILSLTTGQFVGSEGRRLENWFHGSGLVQKNGHEKLPSTYVKVQSSSLSGSVSCEDLEGVGSFNTTCLLNSNLYLSSDLSVYGTGNLEILPHISIVCLIEGCAITFNLSGNVKVSQYATIVAGSVVFAAANMTMESGSSINASSLGGSPPPHTTGTPVVYDGAGGGHGGRGASCLKDNDTNYWGGDVYAWFSLSEPWSYGSKGSGTSADNKFGGNGGGRIKLVVKDTLYLEGLVTAEGGNGEPKGGGGSGGSIFIIAIKLKGYGTISAAGGSGWGGGGGGRISLKCYSLQEDLKVTVHGLYHSHCIW